RAASRKVQHQRDEIHNLRALIIEQTALKEALRGIAGDLRGDSVVHEYSSVQLHTGVRLEVKSTVDRLRADCATYQKELSAARDTIDQVSGERDTAIAMKDGLAITLDGMREQVRESSLAAEVMYEVLCQNADQSGAANTLSREDSMTSKPYEWTDERGRHRLI